MQRVYFSSKIQTDSWIPQHSLDEVNELEVFPYPLPLSHSYSLDKYHRHNDQWLNLCVFHSNLLDSGVSNNTTLGTKCNTLFEFVLWCTVVQRLSQLTSSDQDENEDTRDGTWVRALWQVLSQVLSFQASWTNSHRRKAVYMQAL